jgi:hypothetical protein
MMVGERDGVFMGKKEAWGSKKARPETIFL